MKKTLLIQFVIGLMPDLVLVYFIKEFLFENESGFFYLIIFAFIYVFYFIKWLLVSIFRYVNHLFYGKTMIETIFNLLKDNDLGYPEYYEIEPEEYYATIIKNQNETELAKNQASALYHEIQTIRSLGQMQGLLYLLHYNKKAIEKYHNYLSK